MTIIREAVAPSAGGASQPAPAAAAPATQEVPAQRRLPNRKRLQGIQATTKLTVTNTITRTEIATWDVRISGVRRARRRVSRSRVWT